MRTFMKQLLIEAIVDGMPKEEKEKINKAKSEISKIIYNEDGTVNPAGATALILSETELEIRAKKEIREARNEPDKKDADG